MSGSQVNSMSKCIVTRYKRYNVEIVALDKKIVMQDNDKQRDALSPTLFL